MNFVTPDQRILRGVASTLQVVLFDQNGAPADASGALTVGVKKADGTVVIAAGTVTGHAGTGTYTVAVTAAQAATLEWLTATWTDAGDGSVNTTLVEIIGGFYFSVADVRASDESLDATNYPDAIVITGRDEVSDECEFICGVSFVPRYRRVALDGTGTRELVLPDNRIRTVRNVRIYSDLATGTYISLTSTQLAGMVADADNRIERTDLGTFTEGRGNIFVEYEYGFDRPPTDLRRAVLLRLRHRLNLARTGIPDQAMTEQTPEGQVFTLDQPGAFKTGLREVDGTYGRYSMRGGPDHQQPAGRAVEYDPSFYGLFHGGRR